MHAYLWIKSRQISLKVKNTNQWYGFIILLYFLPWTHGQKELQQFFKELEIKTDPNLKFVYEQSRKEKVLLLELSVTGSNEKLLEKTIDKEMFMVKFNFSRKIKPKERKKKVFP